VRGRHAQDLAAFIEGRIKAARGVA
jgi:hypothetical protein